jgi:hypothetical protein
VAVSLPAAVFVAESFMIFIFKINYPNVESTARIIL